MLGFVSFVSEEEEYFVSGEEEYTCWASSRAKRLVFRVWYSLGRG